MTAVEQAPAKPAIIEGPGRYVVYEAPDGGWVSRPRRARCVGPTGWSSATVTPSVHC